MEQPLTSDQLARIITELHHKPLPKHPPLRLEEYSPDADFVVVKDKLGTILQTMQRSTIPVYVALYHNPTA